MHNPWLNMDTHLHFTDKKKIVAGCNTHKKKKNQGPVVQS